MWSWHCAHSSVLPSQTDAVAVLVDGVGRGWARNEYIPEFDEYRIYMTVYSDTTCCEELEFWVCEVVGGAA